MFQIIKEILKDWFALSMILLIIVVGVWQFLEELSQPQGYYFGQETQKVIRDFK